MIAQLTAYSSGIPIYIDVGEIAVIRKIRDSMTVVTLKGNITLEIVVESPEYIIALTGNDALIFSTSFVEDLKKYENNPMYYFFVLKKISE